MTMKKYVAMAYDECHDDYRVNDIDYEFPSFSDNDETMWEAFLAWENAIIAKLEKDLPAECSGVHLERKYSDMSLSEFGYDFYW